MVLSGCAALTYEICWIRMFGLGLGHEMPAMAGVISAFFGGLALGAWLLDKPIQTSRRPIFWYIGLEAVIALWALVTVGLIPLINARTGTITGEAPSSVLQWSVAFTFPLIALLPATVAMGATVPAMDRIVGRVLGNGRWIGGIYAANTLGAVFGTLATTFVLLPAFGFTRTLWIASATNVFCCILAYVGFASAPSTSWDNTTSWGSAKEMPIRAPHWLTIALFLTGLLGIGFEVLGTRVMAQVQENTVYSFASVLSVYLAGSSIGAFLYQRWLSKRSDSVLLETLFGSLCLTGLVGTLILSRSDTIHQYVLTQLGPGLVNAIATEVALASLVFGPTTMVMGITFSALAQTWRDQRGRVGAAIAINTAGASLASPIFAPLILPAMGSKWSLVGIAVAYLALGAAVFRSGLQRAGIPPSSPRPRRPRHSHKRQSIYWIVGLCIAALGLAASTDLRFVTPLEGGTVLDYRDGVLGAVAVVTDQHGHRYLKVNDRFRMGGTDSASNERRLGHLPLLLHETPRTALFLGLGTGNTLAAAAAHPKLSATAVELVPEIVQMQPYFEASTGVLSSNPRMEMIVSDARRFVRASHSQYDVVVADLFHPARDGSGALYTREHFEAIRERLRSGGLFCQWLPLYQMDSDCLKIIVRTFLECISECDRLPVHLGRESSDYWIGGH